ncbi:hypothetical protein BD770DRAFT_412837 [Pilaira anomala]|nr:hypothetical protein BD770DRAFT_412837 [Pilaira anomala]
MKNEVISVTRYPIFINEVSALLSQDLIPQELLTKAKHEEYRVRCTEIAAQEIVEASEKISSISLILLQDTKSVLTAVQASIKVSEAVALATELVITQIEVEQNDTKRHKWDGTLSKTEDKTVTGIMMIEFTDSFTHVNFKKLNSSEYQHNYTRTPVVEFYSETVTPSDKTIKKLSHQVYFEWLTLVTDYNHVRTREATLDIPYFPEGLRTNLNLKTLSAPSITT